MASAPDVTLRRVRVRVEGTVQGVGFRPYVHRLATELGLSGHVLNDEHGVLVEVQGPETVVDAFVARLPAEAPALAEVERVVAEDVPVEAGPDGGFAILGSAATGEPAAMVSADTATCPACLAELLDPADRRYRYPFINCTDCGPRFTIVRGVPYDRPNTTMAGFAMCAACQAEYDDPSDRRFHAQANACPTCGPAARLEGGEASDGGDTIAAAAALLRGGAIVAVKGIGGYHLACLAGDEDAVATLRARKHREERPFAVMAPDLPAAEALVELDDGARALLCSPRRPIVLAPRRTDAPVAAAVAPRSPDLGVMLPYAPLHHLLLADAGAALVLTSGNLSDEPIAFRDEDALERLAGIADAFLTHDRPIETRTDDSVVRAVAGRTLLVRRSRGYVPGALALPVAAQRPLLAVGAHLKNTFCVAKGNRAWISHHIGDLENWETLRSFREGVAHFEALFAVSPELVAHDLHPGYLSTAEALAREGVETLAVQHHHAHLAACLAEHGETGPAVGAILDGTGYGTDGTVWGGELLVGDLAGFERVGHLRPVRLPGGHQAVREPWRMACAWLGGSEERPDLFAAEVDAGAWRAVAQLAGSELAPVTTSAGRLFDAVAALAGVRTRITYEGQAAVELEAAADPAAAGAYEIAFDGVVLDPSEAIRAIASDAAAGAGAGAISTRFHRGLADALARACERIASERGTELVVLSGGVFQNRLLTEGTAARLEAAGLRLLLNERVPANDGGISFGQAAVAAAAARPG